MGARSSIYSEYGCCVQPDDEMEKRRATSHVMIQVVGSASLLPLLGLPPTLRQNPKNNGKPNLSVAEQLLHVYISPLAEEKRPKPKRQGRPCCLGYPN